MKFRRFLPTLVFITGFRRHGAEKANPIEKVVELISSMQQKIIQQGEEMQHNYADFSKWCGDRSRELSNEIKVARAEASNLQAVVEREGSTIASLDTKIGDLSARLSTDEADLKAATLLRKKEASDFSTEQTELLGTNDMLQRAVLVLKRDASAASLVQTSSSARVVAALSELVKAGALSHADSSSLAGLLQEDSGSAAIEDLGDQDFGAPDPAVYASKSGSLVETLQGLLEKSEAQLEEVRKEEVTSNHNFQLLKLELGDKLKLADEEMRQAKQHKAQAGERKAQAEGELGVRKSDLEEDIKGLSELHHKCVDRAADFGEETKTRGEEIEALAKAKQVIEEMTGGAAKQTYDADAAPALLQLVSSVDSPDDAETPPGVRALHAVKALAKKLASPSLSQLCSKLESAVHTAVAAQEDPLSKVRGLLASMVEKLEREAGAEAEHKKYCDQEMDHTKDKKDSVEDSVEDQTTKLDQLSADATKLSEQLASLQRELAELASTQAEMDRIRQEEKASFERSKPELENGLKGVQTALQVLRQYYAKASDDGGGSGQGGASGVIGLLEVAESDFSKGLAELVSEEEAAVTAYEETTKENQVLKAGKAHDVKYAEKLAKRNAKASAELSSDRDGEAQELAAVSEYMTKLEEECGSKPDSYEERKKRREQELAGLREALESLKETSAPAFFQRQLSRRWLRGTRGPGALLPEQ